MVKLQWLALLSCLCSFTIVQSAAPKGRRRRANDVPGQLQVIDDITSKVLAAGGNVKGKMGFSLNWDTHHDLDLHVTIPPKGRAAAEEIFYGKRSHGGGNLDVDMCVQGMSNFEECTSNPVENIVFAQEPRRGRYKVWVRLYNYHENRAGLREEGRAVNFQLLSRVGENVRLFSRLCTKPGRQQQSDVTVFEFNYNGKGYFDPVSAAEPDSSCDVLQIGGTDDDAKRMAAAQRRQPGSGGGHRGHRPGRQPRGDVHEVHLGANNPHRSQQGKGKGRGKGKGGRGGGIGINSAASASASASAPSSWSGKKGRTSARAHAHTRDELKAKRVKTLKRILREEFQDQCRGCTEKDEIVDRILVLTEGAGRSEL
jgi:hypothetical protein